MLKITKVKFSSLFIFAFSLLPLWSFSWPQEEAESDSFYSYFGQARGNTIQSSMIFRDTSTVKSADQGQVVAVLTEHGDDFGWFESTLGNAVIISHSDSLLSVYANLEEDLDESLFDAKIVKSGETIGESGSSGWQEGQSCLEFGIIDTKSHSSINPRVLMPRIGKENELYIGEISLVDRNKKTFILGKDRVLLSGNYSIYRKRQKRAVPYRTAVSVNGAAVEVISYDTLKENDGRLCVQGNSFYPYEVLYPDSERQLICQCVLTKGKNLITVTVTDILGKTSSVNYSLEVK